VEHHRVTARARPGDGRVPVVERPL
jgi:hypothetical protein